MPADKDLAAVIIDEFKKDEAMKKFIEQEKKVAQTASNLTSDRSYTNDSTQKMTPQELLVKIKEVDNQMKTKMMDINRSIHKI